MENMEPSNLCKEFAKTLNSTAQVVNGVCLASRLRTNIHPTVLGRRAESAMFLPQVFTFENMDSKGNGLCLGETVILEEEINPFIAKLQDHGIIVTAVHNHWLFDSPRLMYLHFESIDEPIAFAQKTVDAMSVLTTENIYGNGYMQNGQYNPSNPNLSLRNNHTVASNSLCDEFNRILEGAMHTSQNGQCVVMRTREDIMPTVLGIHGRSYLLGTEMYVFESMTNDGLALCSGEIMLLEEEVNPFIWVLQENGITVTAVHNHWLFDNPRLMYMHFVAIDYPISFAHKVKGAFSVLVTNDHK